MRDQVSLKHGSWPLRRQHGTGRGARSGPARATQGQRKATEGRAVHWPQPLASPNSCRLPSHLLTLHLPCCPPLPTRGFPRTSSGVSLKYLLDFGTQPLERQMLLSARFLHNELPIRLAHRLMDLNALPPGLSDEPHVRRVKVGTEGGAVQGYTACRVQRAAWGGVGQGCAQG